jgi:putative FmdB family regulatory protein
MPIYEYRCEKCQNTFEMLSSVRDSDKKIINCPKCNKKFAHKIPSRFSTLGKGGDQGPLEEDNEEFQNKNRAAINIGNAGNVRLDNLLVKGGSIANVYGNANVQIKNSKKIP